MLKSDFDRFWNNTLVPLAENFERKYTNCSFDKSKKHKVYESYEEIKNKVHSYMQQEGMKIDRHKIAAIITFSIMRNSPFSLNNLPAENPKIIEHLANEYISFASSLSLIRSFIITKCQKENDSIRENIFRQNYVFPDSEHCHYFIAVVRNLYYSKLNQSLDIFTLANLYFMIESYTEIYKKQEMFLNLNPSPDTLSS